MCTLLSSLQCWNTEAFSSTLKREIEELPAGALPLYQCTTRGGLVDDSNITATLLKTTESEQALQVKLGIFFSEIVGGCNCHDDPLVENGYAEIMLIIDRSSGAASFTVQQD